jgi:hypothetical protein
MQAEIRCGGFLWNCHKLQSQLQRKTVGETLWAGGIRYDPRVYSEKDVS